MICRKCQTRNPDSSVYCLGCGAPLLRRMRPKRAQILWLPFLAGAAVLLILAGLLYLFVLRPESTDRTVDAGPPPAMASATAPSETGRIAWIVGEAAVYDAYDEEVSLWGAALVDDGWMALPAAAILGGNTIYFQGGEMAEVRLERAIWSPGEPVALWRVEPDSGSDRLRLATWMPMETLSWRPLGPAQTVVQVDVFDRERRGSFVCFPLPGEIQQPGVLIQDDRIVGWTFGNGFDRGYLWARSAEGILEPNTEFNQFAAYMSVSRESQFQRAWSAKGIEPALRRLEMFAHGFLKSQALDSGDSPAAIRVEGVIAEMHALASELIREGRADAVVRILNMPVLLESADPLLVRDATLAMVKAKDHNRGIQYLEAVKEEFTKAPGLSLSGLESFHAQLYKDWLRKIISEGGYFSAMSAFEEARKAFPDDPEIQLLGVEAAMAEGDNVRAQEILQARGYPAFLKDRVSNLENELKAKREEREALTIRFNPGEEHIPVYAEVNGRHRLKFIVDTGAQKCTIPSSALERLGIEIDDQTTVSLVSGVGGIGLTYEVTLESVALNGWSVKNVKAVIVDLSFDPDCGLLGLNFLDQFRYEIDRQEGILRLSRR
ncbi:MAG: aspartyl protease family protein [Candidatus Aminicenantes bacterium]|nr:aspartyl protease family protein [Candidatus Aminicenantes bacterium]